jgi:hypothetical protein
VSMRMKACDYAVSQVVLMDFAHATDIDFGRLHKNCQWMNTWVGDDTH